MSKITKLTNRAGDSGWSERWTGVVARKDDPIFNVVGAMDETHIAIGACKQGSFDKHQFEFIIKDIEQIQQHMFNLMGLVVCPTFKPQHQKLLAVCEENFIELESIYTHLTDGYSSITQNGWLKYGSCGGVLPFEYALGVIRKAELLVWTKVYDDEPHINIVGQYLNRLSKLFYAYALVIVNHQSS